MRGGVIKSAMVLAAGLGKRMLPLTATQPKALIPVGNHPLIYYTLHALQQYGIDNIILNTHYLSDQLETYVRQAFPDVRFSHEEVLLETGGGVKKALSLLQDEVFFVLNSDCLWRQGLGPVLAQLEANWDPTTMDALLALVAREKAQGFAGRGDYDFTTPPYLAWRGEKLAASWVQASANLIKAKAYDAYSLVPFSNKQVWDDLEKCHKLAGTVIEDDWFDIGNVTGLERAKDALHL